MKMSIRYSIVFWFFSCPLVYAVADSETSNWILWQNEFFESKVPLTKSTSGFWSGRCIYRSKPETETASLALFKQVSAAGGSKRWWSQSIYSSPTAQAESFDLKTLEELKTDPTIQTWIQNEQWNPVSIQNGSWLNGLFIDRNCTRLTETRLSKTEKDVYARVFESGQLSKVCKFSRRVTESLPPNPPTPPPPPPGTGPNPPPPGVWAQTGPSLGGDLNVKNPNPERKIDRVLFTHRGRARVQLSHFRIRLTDSRLIMGGEEFGLNPGETATLVLGSDAEQIEQITFFLWGQTENIEVRSAVGR